ncbi:uncharacterized protein FA14DRAFT_189082 [Meira miltonrushii]|uniref:RNA polymerase II assembly factor Rtp1 C-terminal domain-containing protein n=1 Tax=Meira miltonrushii TaxID=1280837 RepID=A0A316VFI0_9BASI|nr:uncharacterized protein FA14DRAFT_189082 [Meira miltonrushii]PWN35073.1 hypothetical protein FA14DRAFT_189082 [Meira miltonrushii]
MEIDHAESPSSLKELVEVAAILCGQRDEKKIGKRTEEKSERESVKEVLKRRLDLYNERIGEGSQILGENIDNLQRITGEECLLVLGKISGALNQQKHASATSSSSASSASILGSRDRQTLKILIDIINNWNLTLLIASYDQALSCSRPKSLPKLQEIEAEEEATKQSADKLNNARTSLWESISRLDHIFNAFSIAEDLYVMRTLLYESCSVNTLAGAIRIGWGPVQLPIASRQQEDAIKKQGRTIVAHLLKGMTTSTALKILPAAANIGGSGARSPTAYFVKPITEMLFSAQLLRPDGVRALLRNTFPSEERGVTKRLVSVRHLLTNPPAQMPLPVFALQIIPRLLEIVGELPGDQKEIGQEAPSVQSSSAQKNAACFALSRFYELIPTDTFQLLCSHVLEYINPKISSQTSLTEGKVAATESQIVKAITLISMIVEESGPSSGLISAILKHLSIPLFVFYSFLKEQATPSIQTIGQKGKQRQMDQVTDTIYELLITYMRLADVDQAIRTFSPMHKGVFALTGKRLGVLSTEGGGDDYLVPQLRRDSDQQLEIVWHSGDKDDMNDDDALEALNKLNLQDMNIDIQHDQKEKEELPQIPHAFMDALKLIPSPAILSDLLKRSERKSIAAAIFVDLLDACALSKQRTQTIIGSNGLSSHLLYVQCMLQLIDTFGSQILQDQPDKVLEWIAFMLDRREGQAKSVRSEQKQEPEQGIEEIPFIRPSQASSSAISDLLNVNKSDDGAQNELFTDATPNEEDVEMIETALNLLLSLLEGDPKMTLESYSMLKVISAKVDALTSHTNDDIRPIAKEASLVLKARQSSTKVNPAAQNHDLLSDHENAIVRGNEMYQEALKMLQDPILPVRAHGLVVLKDLASHGSAKDDTKQILMDPALIPAILDIFVQAICDDESFLYLNAVKGLSEMANAGGRSMIRRLMLVYLGEREAKETLTQAEVDKRLRIGEALLQVVQRLKLALTAYTSEIVDPLLSAIRNSKLSTTLRSSMLSILGSCIEACPQAMALQGHARSIGDSMMDLLSIELDTKGQTTQEQMDDATLTETRLPQFRRAALILLSLLIRGAALQLEASNEDQQASAWQEDIPQLTSLRMPGGGTLSSIKSKIEKGKSSESKETTLLFEPNQIKRCEQIVGYVAQFDRDALAQQQAGVVMQDLETFKLYIIHTSASTL